MIVVDSFTGQHVAVFGMARSGLAAAQALAAGGAQVCCWDDSEAGRKAARDAGLHVADLNTANWPRYAALILSPGIPLTHPKPHWTVLKAQEVGVPVIGDTELFFRALAELPPNRRPKVIGITGTNGKSTTTALTAHLLREAGRRVAMGGNIGEAVLGLAPFAETDVYVLELSSYQIDLTPSIACDVGILLNLSPDHLDRHGTMEHYAAVKERLIQGAATAIVSLDDPACRKIAHRRLIGTDPGTQYLIPPAPVTAATASRGAELSTVSPLAVSPLMLRLAPPIGIHVHNDTTREPDAVSPADIAAFLSAGGAVIDAEGEKFVTSRDQPPALKLLDLSQAVTLRGPHNAQNAAAAAAAAALLGVSPDDLQDGLLSYPGLAHRMEVLGNLHGRIVINDSKATNADAAAKALASWGSGQHWIVGGKSKDGGIDALIPHFGNVRRAYLIGSSAGDFAQTLGAHGVDFIPCGTLEHAVTAIIDFAETHAAQVVPGAIVFSPACASFDQFRDFEHRGDTFRTLIAAQVGFKPLSG
jgi:UDP-N-acetylmuramoylalanine--D-glutamate ligase